MFGCTILKGDTLNELNLDFSPIFLVWENARNWIMDALFNHTEITCQYTQITETTAHHMLKRPAHLMSVFYSLKAAIMNKSKCHSRKWVDLSTWRGLCLIVSRRETRREREMECERDVKERWERCKVKGYLLCMTESSWQCASVGGPVEIESQREKQARGQIPPAREIIRTCAHHYTWLTAQQERKLHCERQTSLI